MHESTEHPALGRSIDSIDLAAFALGTHFWCGTQHGQRVEFELVDEFVGSPSALVRVLHTNVHPLDTWLHRLVAVPKVLTVGQSFAVIDPKDLSTELAHFEEVAGMRLV